MNPGSITLGWLESHVVQDEDGCWIWKGMVTDFGQPQCSMRTDEGRKTKLVKRLVWELKNERKLATTEWAFSKCQKARCVHPDCVAKRTRGQAMKEANFPHRAVSIATAKRKRSKWSDQQLKDALALGLNNILTAEILGCHHSFVAKVRNGECRRDFSSPFAGLGAR